MRRGQFMLEQQSSDPDVANRSVYYPRDYEDPVRCTIRSGNRH